MVLLTMIGSKDDFVSQGIVIKFGKLAVCLVTTGMEKVP